jgi:hypothetical protein
MKKNKGAAEHGVGRRGKNAVATRDRIPPKLSDLASLRRSRPGGRS